MAISWWGKGLWQIYMDHWAVHAGLEFKNFHQMSDPEGVRGPFHNFDPKLRNERFTLISFMVFPAMLSTLQPFQICIFNRRNSELTFLMALSWWEKGLWQICLHHWTVHAISNGLQLMGKRFMANLHASVQYMQN